MSNFTLDDLARVVREVAAERPEYAYEAPDGGPQCYYLHGPGEPGCIFGHALSRLDVSDLRSFENLSINQILASLAIDGRLVLPEGTGRGDWDGLFAPFLAVQRFQDGNSDGDVRGPRLPWGACVKALDAAYPLAS